MRRKFDLLCFRAFLLKAVPLPCSLIGKQVNITVVTQLYMERDSEMDSVENNSYMRT